MNRYQRVTKSLPIRVLQIGDGNFLRGFVDWMIQVMNQQMDLNLGVAVVKSRPGGNVQAYTDQENLFTVVTKGLRNGKAVVEMDVIDCVQSCFDPYSNPSQFFTIATSSDLEMVFSNTTEAGIVFDEGEILGEDLCINFPAKMTQLLYARYNHFDGDMSKGLCFFPCELIEENGNKLKQYITQYIALWQLPDSFLRWIELSCFFANTLVDRIVPGTSDALKEEVAVTLGVIDKIPVSVEPYHLFVVEGPKRLSEIFPADKAGLNVKFVDSVKPYRDLKVTLLNAPHTLLSPIAYLFGIETVREACENDMIARYIRSVMQCELIPSLDAFGKDELLTYADTVMERFKNPFIDHKVTSIMLNAFSKFKTRVLPSMIYSLDRQSVLPERIVYGLAALIIYYRGKQTLGDRHILPLVNDSQIVVELLSKLWEESNCDVVALGVLSSETLWGEDLSMKPYLLNQLSFFMRQISLHGIQL